MLFSCGSNGNGQLGLKHLDDTSKLSEATLPFKTNAINAIQAIRGGGNHTLILTQDGIVYSTGLNTYGQTGISTQFEDPIVEFTRITPSLNEQQWSLVAAAWESSFFVTEDGRSVYSCGRGARGELGLGSSVNTSLVISILKQFVPPGEKILQIVAGMSHAIVILTNGDAYGWGDGRKGQLGSPQEIVWEPRLIENLQFKVVQAVCGKDFTLVAGDSSSGLFSVLGSDKWGIRSKAPSEITDWKSLVAGWGTIHVLKDNGSLSSWGRADFGQIGTNIPPIQSIAAGSEHAIALTIGNEIIAWGWGEHGNTGQENPAIRGESRPETLGLPISSTTVPDIQLSAGCATSWVYSI
jgi:protein ATS1